MNNRIFGQRSLVQLNTCHPDLQLIAKETLKQCPIDFSIIEGYRSFQTQLEYFLASPPKTSLDPRITENYKKAKHLRFPSEAFDFCAYIPGHPEWAYDVEHITFIAGWICSTAAHLKAQGKISHNIIWGGNWDNDGIILKDQKLWDRPHIELS